MNKISFIPAKYKGRWAIYGIDCCCFFFTAKGYKAVKEACDRLNKGE